MKRKHLLKKARRKLLKFIYLEGVVSVGSARQIGYRYSEKVDDVDYSVVARKLDKYVNYLVGKNYLERFEHGSTRWLRIKK